MKKFLALLLIPAYLLGNLFFPSIFLLSTNGNASPWTREKATHLARSVLMYADSGTIDTLYQAGSAEAAVNILFPDQVGPDRTAFNNFINTYTSSGFNWGDGNHAIRLYQFMYAADPYEAKRKLFSLYEDIFSVNIDNERGIVYRDIANQHGLIYENMLGNYETLVKKLLYNNGNPGDFTEGAFLDLFNQTNPNNPNENYARELLQLFLMGEYEPFKTKENNDTRNYEESDVKALARILTGLRSDSVTHAISFDVNTHYSGSSIVFLSGTTSTLLPGYYNSASGTIDPNLILTPSNGNNGLTDNVIEYIFAKKSQQISLFLADRIFRFYIHDHPTRTELDTIAQIIQSNNFEMLPSIKSILALDMMYSNTAMNTIRYKNPLELAIGTVKLLQNNTFSGIILDPNIYDTNLLRRLGWTPYYPGSVFGRDGFDDSLKWSSTSNQNAWMNATNYFTYRNGTGTVNFRNLLGSYRKELTTEIIPVLTNSKNTFTGSLTIVSGILDPNPPTLVTIQSLASESGTILDLIQTESGSDTSTGTVENTIIIDSSTGSTTESGSTNTGETSTESGSTDSGTTDTGSTAKSESIIDAQEIIIDTGSINPENISPIPESKPETSESENSGEVMTFNAANETIAITSGSVMLPNFQIITDAGTVTVASGSYNASSKTLSIASGSLTNSGNTTPIYSGSIVFSANSNITADVLTTGNLIDIFSSYFLGDITLPSDVRNMIQSFLTLDESGNPILVTPNSTEYYDKKIRGLASIILSQPEYVLLRGATLPPSTDTDNQHFLDNITGKLIFIELYGGDDYLSSIIPKDEYSTYLDYRTNSSGSIAIQGQNLVDIGNFYMNSALAYGSGGGAGFKSLYDEGSLKIFNRVGGYKHSQDHDAAAKQITSFSNTTDASAEGLFGHLVSQEFESSHTISLGAKRPNIYRGGHYVNMGGSVILTNPMNNSIKYHMDILGSMAQTRAYPSNTRSLFSDAGRISDIAKVSVAAGGPSGANGDMKNVFNFAKILMENNIGRSYYMGGYGGYDTHGDQLNGLNNNLQFVSTAVTNFFNEVKNTQDVTIVIFSEFGRTNKINGSQGTDHGDGGGMFVVTSNQNLKNLLQNGTYGNMSIRNAKANALGIGVDYRSLYGKVFEALYNLNGKTYFQDDTVSLEDDISLDPSEVSLLSYSYQASGQNVIMNGEFTMSGRNYNPGKAGYTRLLAGTGSSFLKNTTLNSLGKASEGYKYAFRIGSSSQPVFQINSFSNQYTLTSIAGTTTGSTTPRILGNSVRSISQTGSSILPVFNNTQAPSLLSGSGIILENSLTGKTLVLTGMNLHFASGTTQVTELTSSSGNLVWNGGFILGERMNRDYFIPSNARIISDGTLVQKERVSSLMKIGADKLGVGMKLNQNVEIEFTNIEQNTGYRAITSEDGIHWSDVEFPGKEYQANGSGSILVPTNHFSYFALLSSAPTQAPPTCTMNITPATATNGTPVALTWNLMNTQTGILTPGNTILAASGTSSITPPQNTTTQYSISVSNSAGTASCSASVTTNAVVIPPVVNPGNPTTPSNGNSTTGPGGGGYSMPVKTLDVCVDGDFSGNAYDGMCDLPSENTISGSSMNNNPVQNTPTVKKLNNPVLDTFIAELEKNETHTLSARDEQYIIYIALGLWKDILHTSASSSAGTQATLASLKTKMKEVKQIHTKNALSRIMGTLQNFTNITKTTPQKSQTLALEPASTRFRYVDVEHALNMRTSTFLLRNNVITYLSHNEKVQVLEDLGSWTKILYNGIEGYVKSSYLQDSLSMR